MPGRASFDLAAHRTATTGTGALTLGAATPGQLTLSEAGAQDGYEVSYTIRTGSPGSYKYEQGWGVVGGNRTTLTRNALRSSDGNETPLDLAGTSDIYFWPHLTDVVMHNEIDVRVESIIGLMVIRSGGAWNPYTRTLTFPGGGTAGRVVSPLNSAELAAWTPQSNDTLLLRSGIVYAASSMPAIPAGITGLTIGVSGTGAKPILSGAATQSTWTYDAGNNVYASPAYADKNVGVVLENGVPMKLKTWNTNLATTAAAMATGSSAVAGRWAGSYTFNPNTNILYIRPSSGTPTGKTYTTTSNSGAANQDNGCGLALYGASGASRMQGVTVDGIRFENITRHGIVAGNINNLRVTNCEMRYIGGFHPNTDVSLHHGNCIEIGGNAQNILVDALLGEDVLDTIVTCQMGGTGDAVSEDHTYSNITGRRYGMHFSEFTLFNAASGVQRIEDVLVAHGISTDQGLGWSDDRQGAGLNILNNRTTPAGSGMTRIFAHNLVSNRNYRLYLGSGHGGICGIQESSCASSTQPINGSSGTNYYRAISDGVGGGPWGNMQYTALDLRALIQS